MGTPLRGQKHGAGSRGLGKEKEKELRRDKGVRKKKRGKIMEERGLCLGGWWSPPGSLGLPVMLLAHFQVGPG